MRRGLVAFIVILLAVGCGEDEVPPPAEASGGRVYLLLDGKVWPAFRDAPLAGDAADEIVEELLLGPSDEELERGIPGGGLVMGRARAEDHRRCQAPLVSQPVVGFSLQLCNRVSCKKLRRDALFHSLICDGLGAILTKFCEAAVMR